MGQGPVFVVISCQGVADAIKDAVDQGRFSEARSLSYQAAGLARKLASHVQEKGGHLDVFLLERQVMEVPSTVAEDMPNYLEPYMSELPGMVAAGMGLTFREAVSAMQASEISGEIEMYDPDNVKFSGVSEYVKAEQPYQIPVNMFDVTVPGEKPIESDEDFKSRPSADEEMQAQAMLVQALAQIMGGGQQMQQPQQQDPRDLREALEGGQIDGYQPHEDAGDKSPKKDSKGSDSGDKSPKKDTSDKEVEKEEEGDTDDRLDKLLHGVKASIPQIMALHDKNPEAYKAAMSLVQKLVAVAKERRVKKAEEITDALNKALKLPIGSRRGNRRKVLVNGREAWRQMASGQVQDQQGQPISVKSSNKASEGKG